jgi:hypothetical protein
MTRLCVAAAILAVLGFAPGSPAAAQPLEAGPPPPLGPPAPPAHPAEAVEPVQSTPLAPLDLFSPAARETGLGPDLWRDASADIARTVFAILAKQPLSPAGATLARRVLATGATAPPGAGQDRALAGARALALIAQGDPAGGAAILGRTAGVERDPGLSEAAAEAALLAGEADQACATAERLGIGRDGIYWLRLRAYCQAREGRTDAARLTFQLAQGLAKDPVYARLMGARLAPPATPPAASLRNGLDLTLSRDLGLDLSAAKPAPAVASALAAGGPTAAPVWTARPVPGDVGAALAALAAGDGVRAALIRASLVQDQTGASPLDLAVLDAALAVANGRADGPTLSRLVERAGTGEAKARARAQAAALLLAAAGSPLDPAPRAAFAAFAVEAKASAARAFVLDRAAEAKRPGETALVALWIAADAGVAGPGPGDRARIVRALRTAGLETDARNFALEGLLTLP